MSEGLPRGISETTPGTISEGIVRGISESMLELFYERTNELKILDNDLILSDTGISRFRWKSRDFFIRFFRW